MQTNARKKARRATSAEQSRTSAQQRSQPRQPTLHAFFKNNEVLGGEVAPTAAPTAAMAVATAAEGTWRRHKAKQARHGRRESDQSMIHHYHAISPPPYRPGCIAASTATMTTPHTTFLTVVLPNHFQQSSADTERNMQL